MSVAKNNIVRQIAPKTIFGSALGVLSTSVTYNQGDLIAFDATNKILKPVTGAGDAANILASRSNIVTGLQNPLIKERWSMRLSDSLTFQALNTALLYISTPYREIASTRPFCFLSITTHKWLLCTGRTRLA